MNIKNALKNAKNTKNCVKELEKILKIRVRIPKKIIETRTQFTILGEKN